MVAVDATIARLQRHCRSIAKIGRHYIAPADDDRRQVVFVAGQQRSGTNMLMDVLERHWRTDVFHETDVRAFDRYQMRDVAAIERLVAQSKASHVVIKSLCELQRLRELLDTFPRTRAIWVIRHYHDVANSMAKQFSSTADVLKKMRADPALGGWRGERMSASIKTLLDDCIKDDVSEISAAAFQWYMRNRLFFDQDLSQDRRVRIVFYEDLVTKPELTFRAVADFLDIAFHPSMIADVFATSVNKTAKPSIDPRIEALCRQLFDRFAIAARTQACRASV
ncbi:MAG: sulfotransferase family protein [Geminicoccaceae bacterium]